MTNEDGTWHRISRTGCLTAPLPTLVTVMLAGLAMGPTGIALAQQSPLGEPASSPIGDEADERLEGAPIRELQIVEPTGDGAPGAALDLGAVRTLTGTDLQLALNNVRSEPGTAYSVRTVRDDVGRLNRLGRFSRIDAYAQPLSGGAVRVVYRVVLQPTIEDVQSAGNRRVSDQEISGVADLLIGTPVDPFQIDRAVRRIEDLYRDKGYFAAQVTVDELQLAENGVVLFKIREGQRVRIKGIELRPLEGRLELPEKEIRRRIETRRSGVFRTGEIDETQLDIDEAEVRGFYRDNGFLDARVSSTVEPAPGGGEAIITFIIDQGRQYTLRSIEVRISDPENSPFDEAQVVGHMTISPGQTYGVADVRASIAAVRDAYGRLGHVGPLETPRQRSNPGIVIETVELRDPDEPRVDLIVELTAGPPSETGLVRIAGNDLTRHEPIRREIQVFPGDVLDWPALRESQRDIRNSRLFDPSPPNQGVKVTIQDPQESTRLPGDPPADASGAPATGSGRIAPADLTVRDVLIEVEETNTGSFDIGAAVSSDAGLLGRIALTQRNFDVTDTPDSFGEFATGRAFRGDAQTFRIEAQPGTEVQVYSISLSEPSLFETDYTGSAQIFFRDREFDEFDEQRFGASFSFGRRFGTRWRGSVRTRIESVEISSIDQNFPEDFFLFTDPTLLIGVGPTLTRTTTDDLLFPTRGTRTEIGFEHVEGDTSFSEVRGEHIVFIPVYEDFRGRRTVISFRTQAAYIPQDSDDVPVFERLYLGGQTFRGFGFRTVSPKGVRQDTGAFSNEPIGGTWLYINTLEARQPLVGESVYGAVFMDAGTVRSDVGFDDWRVAAGVGIRVRIPQLSPAPLAFDFGFPIVKQFGDEERIFSFSLDLPF